jgi:hypothetical protein
VSNAKKWILHGKKKKKNVGIAKNRRAHIEVGKVRMCAAVLGSPAHAFADRIHASNLYLTYSTSYGQFQPPWTIGQSAHPEKKQKALH